MDFEVRGNLVSLDYHISCVILTKLFNLSNFTPYIQNGHKVVKNP